MGISAAQVKELREKSGAGIMDCKEALKEANGQVEAAMDVLRKRGLSKAAKRAARATGEGLVGSYIHAGGKIGVLVEVNCETDFVAKTEIFQQLVKDLAMHVAASNPLYVSRDQVPEEVVEKEREIFLSQAREEGKPEKVLDRIVEGRMEKHFEEVCLVDQPYIRDTDRTVQEHIVEAVAQLGENIVVRRFERFHVGGG
ncbi:translation elongation factor Ts [Nitrospinae bacterium AH_259_B05_G02_I21]|nr:translation elongation factor Ts [Nitrospinae bacterium AH_259_B05_G02_I21]MDA2931979.1 translation elongation factor Ts [Nitrospinae bacterium AH-259-F20]